MHRHRFYLSSPNIISQPEYHHIVSVLRYKEGDTIILFDGKGNEYIGKISAIDRKARRVRVSIEKSSKEQVARPLVLVQGLIRSSSMDIIIQKATELGVTHIYPIITKNSIVRAGKINKWQRIVEEACKQCGRNWLPYIDKVWDLEEAVSSLDWIENKLVCTPNPNAKSLKDIPPHQFSENWCGGIPENTGSTAVMIGPEGDFTKGELESVCSRGWTPVHLGKTLLRAETAAISVLGAVCYKFGYWD